MSSDMISEYGLYGVHFTTYTCTTDIITDDNKILGRQIVTTL